MTARRSAAVVHGGKIVAWLAGAKGIEKSRLKTSGEPCIQVGHIGCVTRGRRRAWPELNGYFMGVYLALGKQQLVLAWIMSYHAASDRQMIPLQHYLRFAFVLVPPFMDPNYVERARQSFKS